MTQTQTPNTENQAKPNNLSAIDKKIADAKATEQQATVQASGQSQADKAAQPGADTPAPQGDTPPTKN